MTLSAEHFSNMNISYYYGHLTQCTSQWQAMGITCLYSKFYYVISGECIIEIDGIKYKGEKGRLFLIPAGVKHSYYHANSDYVRKYWFHFSFDSSGSSIFDHLLIPIFIDIAEKRTADRIKRLFEDIFKYSSDSSLEGALYLRARITELTALYFLLAGVKRRIGEGAERGISNVLRYINDNISNNMSVNELADFIHLHPVYFIRLFKNTTGDTPAKYISKLRMERTKSLLENTDIQVKEIMHSVGFDDYSHFCKFFKKYCGYSPTQFREIYKSSV